jgi:hypothetical protein
MRAACLLAVLAVGCGDGGKGAKNPDFSPPLSAEEREKLSEERDDLITDIVGLSRPDENFVVTRMKLMRVKLDRLEAVYKKLGEYGPDQRSLIKTGRDNARRLERAAAGIIDEP